MVKLLQDLVPWLVAASFSIKLTISFVVVSIALALLVIIWTPVKPKLEESKPGTTTPADQSKPIESTKTGVPVATLLWPQEKTLESLKRRLIQTSQNNRKILLAIADSGNNGMYPQDLMNKFRLSREDVISRTRALAEVNLIEIRQFTDVNYRLHDDVWNAVGANGKDLLRALLN